MSLIANTPNPPYYAVIFTSIRMNDDDEGYAVMSSKMKELAAKQPGFLGIESVREELGITVSYWRDLESIKAWKTNIAHIQAQDVGREKWYSSYKIRICKVERYYDFSKDVPGKSGG